MRLMQNQKKSDQITISVSITHPHASALESSMITEAKVYRDNNVVTINESANFFVDLRARWNTIMRGIVAADEALNTEY